MFNLTVIKKLFFCLKRWNLSRSFPIVRFVLFIIFPNLLNAQFTTYNAGQAFTCITVDSNYNIWAGTSKAGIYLLDKKSNALATQFAITSTGSLSTYNIQTLAADKYNNVWVGHNGLANTGASGGGIERFDINNPVIVKHYAADANAECLSYVARDGLASSNSASITADKNGTVWSAHKYNDLFVSGLPPDIPAQYILTPGSLSYKPATSASFTSKGTYIDYRNRTDAPELPYPAYTCNPSPTQTPQSRNCYAVACGNNEVWVSVAPYIAKNGGSFPARLLKYNLDGKFIASFDYYSMQITPLGVYNGIYVTPQGKVWVTMSAGLILYFDGSHWHTVTLPASFPASIRANSNAITGDKFGHVYIGTNSGLIVCNANPMVAGSSFKLYTTADGLPSSNITGIAAERNGSVWLATNGGIVKFSPPSFAVYNLIHPAPGNEINADKFQIVSANDKTLQIDGKPIEVNVAADSSSSTMFVYTGASPETLEFSIAGTSVDNDPFTPEIGKIKELVRNKDSLVYLYHHPSYVFLGDSKMFVPYSIGLRDKNTKLSVVQGKLNIYHTPVLLAHGVWSSVKSLDGMANYLLKNSSNYQDYQILKTWFSNSNHSEPSNSEFYYRDKVSNGIDVLLQQCRENGLSAGKVNYVGHSRGGLYGRYYLQNTFQFLGYPYRNDINSIITINSPHFGSQTANLVLDKRKLLGIWEVGKLFGSATLSDPDRPGGDDPNGAIELAVDAGAITKDLNGDLLNSNVVPSHAITTQYMFGLSKADLLKRQVINSSTYIPLVGGIALYLRLYALTSGSACLEGSIDNCLKEIFDTENNDVVVPISSQRGGLEDKAVTLLQKNLGHSKKTAGFGLVDVPGVMDDITAHDRVAELLRQNPDADNANFTKNGYHPGAQLKYTFLPNLLKAVTPQSISAASSSVLIDNSIKGKTYKYGDTVQVKLTGSGDIKTLLIAYSSLSLAEPSSDVAASNALTFTYPIPKEALGNIMIVAYGFNENGLLAIDSSFINIGIPANAKLDSIKLERNGNDFLQVAARDSISLSVTGYFSDTVRNITYLPGVTYSFLAGEIASASSPNYLVGIRQGGFDQLKVTYMGKTDSITVQVTDSINLIPANGTLPVNFTSFTGQFKNNNVQLWWTTAQEENNKQFEVQHSVNGVDYETIGVVSGKGNSNIPVNYFYTTDKYKTGKNYYRLKQIDLDGKYKFSPIVVVIVDKKMQSSFSIYPNPATNKIVIGVKQPSDKNLQLQLADISGRKVWSKVITGNSNSIPVTLPKLNRGVYVITILNDKDEKLFNDKLIIQ